MTNVTEHAPDGGNAPEEKAASADFIEYKGDPQYGVEFLASHTISRKDAKEGAWGIEIPSDLVWEKRAGGPYRGRMLLSTEGMTEETLASLENEPGFKRVSLKK
jgi:hypothetical protein